MRWSLALVAAAALAIRSPAMGEEQRAPTKQERNQARDRVSAAEKLIAQGKLEAALSEYERAVRLVDVPAIWLMIGRVRAQLKRLAAAAEAFERAATFPLEPNAPPASRSAVERAKKELADVLPRVPELRLRVVDGGAATLTVDGRPLEDAREPLSVDPGTHRIVARAPGKRPLELDLEIAEGERLVVPIALAPETAAQGSSPIDDRTPPAVHTVIAAAGFSLAGAGLVVGGVTGLLALDHASDLEASCGPTRRSCPPSEQSRIDDATILGHISTVGFVVGAAGLAAGVIALVLGSGEDDEDEAAPPEEARRGPAIAPCAAGGLLGVCGAL